MGIWQAGFQTKSVWISKTQQTTQNSGEAPTRIAEAASHWDGEIQTMTRTPENLAENKT